MASYTYVTAKCPKCNKVLFKGNQTITIGSPLMQCPSCKTLYKCQWRREWYDYPYKGVVYWKPLIMMLIGLACGALTSQGNVALAVGLGALMLLIGVFMSISDIFRIRESKARMKDPKYLDQLLAMRLISEQDYLQFYRAAVKSPVDAT